MGLKLLWTGVVFILGIVPALKAFGLQANDALVLVGSVIALIGLILHWMDK
jgi:nicotinamide riboside transporter PnuC